MMRTQFKTWARGSVLLALAAGILTLVPLKSQLPQLPAVEPQANQEALQPNVRPEQGEVAKQAQKLMVTNPLAADVVITQKYVCQIASQSHIAIRPLVSGFLEQASVMEGAAVKKGDVLFKILPVVYQAKLDIELTDVKIAQIEFDNSTRLSKNKVISPDELALSQAKLQKAQAKARLAETELNFTNIRAPFDGSLGRVQMQPGSLVKEGDTLATLTENSVVRAYFKVPEVKYLEYMTKGGPGRDDPHPELILANGSKLTSPSPAMAIEADSQHSPGTVTFRADFPNPGHLLLHGQNGNVLLHQPLANALVIPQRSTFETIDQRYVYVVGKDGVVHQREISIQHEMEDYFVIQKGLDANDRILIDGIQRVRDGEIIEPEFRKPEEVMPILKKHVE